MALLVFMTNPISYLHFLAAFLFSTTSWLLGWLSTKYPDSRLPDLNGKVAIVTGADSGLGQQIARQLVEIGCAVWMGCNSVVKGQEAASGMKSPPSAIEAARVDRQDSATDRSAEDKLVRVRKLDMSSLQSVRDFVADWQYHHRQVDYLIHAAEVEDDTSRTPEGLATIYAANFLGPFAADEQAGEQPQLRRRPHHLPQ